MNFYNTISIVIVLAAFIAYINKRFFKMPNTIGVMFISVIVSSALMLLSNVFPKLFTDTVTLLDTVDFGNILIGSMLSFLLFAGTIQLRIKDLRKQQLSVILFQP